MAPRGLKKFLTDSSPGKLVRGKYTGFKAFDRDGNTQGRMLKGITKLLHTKLYSTGTLDESATKSTEFRGKCWRGGDGGIRRGKAIDSQVSRLASASVGKRNSSSKFKLTRLAFGALEAAGLEPITGQRVVLDEKRGIATACDVVCYRKQDSSLVVVELKTGYSSDRTMPATTKKNQACFLASPCSTASDCVLNRHFAQLSVTRHLLSCERSFVKSLKDRFGICSIHGALLYACDRDSSLYHLEEWWVRRSKRIVDTIST